MLPRKILAFAVLPLTLTGLYFAWNKVLLANEHRVNASGPPPVLINAHATLQNRLNQLDIQTQQALNDYKFGKWGLGASAFSGVRDPGGFFFQLPSMWVNSKSLDANVRNRLQTYSNEVMNLYIEYGKTTQHDGRLRRP